MKLSIHVENSSGVDLADFGVTDRSLKKVLQTEFKKNSSRQERAIGVIFVPPNMMRRLNKQHRHVDRVTNVLAFPQAILGPEKYLGDIVICPQQAKAEAASFGTSIEETIAIYLRHGLKNLLEIKSVVRLKKGTR